MKKTIGKTIWLSAFLIFFVSLTLSLTIILFLINQKYLVDSSNIDLFDLILKGSLTFIGSSLSGFVALFIFYLNHLKDNKTKWENNQKFNKKLEVNFQQNIKVIASISESLSAFEPDVIAAELMQEGNISKELLLFQYTQIEYDTSKEYLKELDSGLYLIHIDEWNKIKKIKDYLDLLLHHIENERNAAVIIGELKKIFNLLNFNS